MEILQRFVIGYVADFHGIGTVVDANDVVHHCGSYLWL